MSSISAAYLYADRYRVRYNIYVPNDMAYIQRTYAIIFLKYFI